MNGLRFFRLTSVAEIADAEEINVTQVRRLMRLTLLAPAAPWLTGSSTPRTSPAQPASIMAMTMQRSLFVIRPTADSTQPRSLRR